MKQKKKAGEASKANEMFAILGYMACSSLMLIVNKLTVHFNSAPAFNLWCQLFSTAAVSWSMGQCNIVEVDALESKKVQSWAFVACIFLATLYTNQKTLQYSNVETFIVFRASTPLIIAMGDYLFLGRELPNFRSFMCLIGLLVGASIYVLYDNQFVVRGYFWVAMWYLVFSVDQLYIKHVFEKVKMKGAWGRVFYQNLLASIPLIPMIIVGGEVFTMEWTSSGLISLFLSCVMSLAIGYFVALARKALSATYFTIVGNVCKVLTVIINQVIWDNHANTVGVGALTFCLVCAYFYQQAPKRKTKGESKSTSAV